jgi:hypothetical protein
MAAKAPPWRERLSDAQGEESIIPNKHEKIVILCILNLRLQDYILFV